MSILSIFPVYCNGEGWSVNTSEVFHSTVDYYQMSSLVWIPSNASWIYPIHITIDLSLNLNQCLYYGRHQNRLDWVFQIHYYS